MYALFYLTYMPTVTNIKPVYMQYNKLCDDKTCNSPEDIASPYHSFPTAHVQLNKKQTMMVGQPYIISVRLDMPETPRNELMGMFQVCMDMKDGQNFLKHHACRSTMLRYRSPLLQKIKTIAFMPLYILGFYEQRQEVDVEIFTHYTDTTNSVTDIYVEIQSKVIEFYSVTLHITAHFTGLRFIIFHFPILSAIVGVAVNLVILLIIFAICWFHWDAEIEWIEEARKKYSGLNSNSNSKSKLNALHQESSSETLSILEYNESESNSYDNELKDDDFFFGGGEGARRRENKTVEE